MGKDKEKGSRNIMITTEIARNDKSPQPPQPPRRSKSTLPLPLPSLPPFFVAPPSIPYSPSLTITIIPLLPRCFYNLQINITEGNIC